MTELLLIQKCKTLKLMTKDEEEDEKVVVVVVVVGLHFSTRIGKRAERERKPKQSKARILFSAVSVQEPNIFLHLLYTCLSHIIIHLQSFKCNMEVSTILKMHMHKPDWDS